MIAGVLSLTRRDMKKTGVTDLYSIHRVFCDMFTPTKEEVPGEGLGVLFREMKGNVLERQFLFLSDREPVMPEYGSVRIKKVPETLLSHEIYRFEVVVNPVYRVSRVGTIVPVKGPQAIADWFCARCEKSWGFRVDPRTVEVVKTSLDRFTKKGHSVTLGRAQVKGVLQVTDRALFEHAFRTGIGRGKAFGCGLLQIIPLK